MFLLNSTDKRVVFKIFVEVLVRDLCDYLTTLSHVLVLTHPMLF